MRTTSDLVTVVDTSGSMCESLGQHYYGGNDEKAETKQRRKMAVATRLRDNQITGRRYFFYRPRLCGTVDWKRSSAPAQLRSCSCGSTAVEEKADGLVTRYRCADCLTSLGDITMGHEP
jgi:hypothetical protein